MSRAVPGQETMCRIIVQLPHPDGRLRSPPGPTVRDPEMPATRTDRRYKLRSRLRCSICHRRMSGRSRARNGHRYTNYWCPHEPGLPRHYAAYPGHRTVAVREEAMMTALARFFTERVFGADRAAMLTTQLPASAAG